MKWQILLFILLIPCVYAGDYTIGHSMQPMTGLTVNSNGYSFRFSSGLNEPTYKFNDSYTGKLGILQMQKKFIAIVLNQTTVTQQNGRVVKILKQINNCGLTLYAEEMTLSNRNIRYVLLDKYNKTVNYTIDGSKLFNYEPGKLSSKLPLIFNDDVYLTPENCEANIKIPIPKKTIAISWGIVISFIGMILIYVITRRQR